MSLFDIDRYFSRVGYTGPRAATLDVLRELHRLHPLAIPFENLDPLTGRRVSLEPDDIAAKLVGAQRGGYCFEQNALFARVLTQLGFQVRPLFARVLWGRELDTLPARTHMVLRVEIEGDAWLADVGFGAVTLCAPLAFAERGTQRTPRESARLTVLEDNAVLLESLLGERWANVYRFDLIEAGRPDFEVANWYTSTSPDSVFTGNLMLGRVTPHGRIAMFNDRLTERDASGAQSSVVLRSARELEACLAGRFGIALDGFDINALFARIEGRGAEA